jgi:hypothetical protein
MPWDLVPHPPGKLTAVGVRRSGCCPPSVPCCKSCLRFAHSCCLEIWCGVGPEICKLLCAPPLPSRIASKLAFAPPRASYDIVLDEATNTHQLWMETSTGPRLFTPANHAELLGGVCAFPVITCQYCLLTPGLQWQSRGN